MKKEAIYTVDGQPVKLNYISRQAMDATLKEALGDDIISAKHARNAGIKGATLRSWRNKGKLRAMKINSTWFYSQQDLLELIKTS